MPANTGLFFNVLMQIAAFEFLDTDDWYQRLINKETKPLTENFGIMGFDSMWFINNMGSMGVLTLFIPIIYLLYAMTKCCESD